VSLTKMTSVSERPPITVAASIKNHVTHSFSFQLLSQFQSHQQIAPTKPIPVAARSKM
jgi:hypothetical protein